MEHSSPKNGISKPSSKYNARAQYEKQVHVRFKRWARQFAQETIQKRNKYSSSSQVQQRRSWLNKRRRILIKATISLLKNGEFLTVDGKKYNIRNGVLIKEEPQVYGQIDKKGKITWCPFTDDLSLLDIMPEATSVVEEDLEFQHMLKKFVEGDPEVVNLIKKRKTVMEYEDPNYANNLGVITEQAKKKLRIEIPKKEPETPLETDSVGESDSESDHV